MELYKTYCLMKKNLVIKQYVQCFLIYVNARVYMYMYVFNMIMFIYIFLKNFKRYHSVYKAPTRCLINFMKTRGNKRFCV